MLARGALGRGTGLRRSLAGRAPLLRRTASLADLPQVAAAIAAQTERIRIGTACMVAPFHDPIQLAERIAMVDSLSGGRFDAGFGRGYQAHEFQGFGIPMDEATGRYQECVEIVSRLLTEENVSFQGKFFAARGRHHLSSTDTADRFRSGAR